jgi:cell division protein FtsQ
MQQVKAVLARRSVTTRASLKKSRPSKARPTGRRNKNNPASGFARLKQGILMRGRISGLLFGSLFLVFILAASVYGLVHSGQIETAQQNAETRFHAFLARTGFTVEEIILQGRERTDRDAVVNALGVTQGELLFFFDVHAARKRIEGLEWVTQARVQRLWPNRLQVVLTEREPLALWQNNSVLSLVDADGFRVLGEDPHRFSHLPLIVGHGAAEAAAEFIALLARYPVLEPRVRAMVRVGDRRWRLHLENGVVVDLPELEVEAALKELVALDNRYRLLSRDIRGVDLRLNDRVVIRMPESADAKPKSGAKAGTPATPSSQKEHDA